MKFIKAKRILIKNGFNQIVFSHSDHIKFYNSKGCHISLPVKKEINDMMWRRLVKENNIIIK